MKTTSGDREWRETSDTRRALTTLAIILSIAGVLRFWALGAGIPYSIGVDEPEIMNRAVQMMRTGDFNPHFFDYGGLYIYLQLAVATIRFIAGAMAGEWHSLNDVSPEQFYVWGRALTALLGTLTVLLVYQIGMRWGTRYALLAAGLLAVLPMHVRESHYILTDVPMTFLMTLTFLLSLRAHERASVGAFAWAGATAGFATATKYPGAISLVLPLVALWMTPATQPSRVRAALGTVAAWAAGFLLFAPYTVLDLPGFLNGFAKATSYYTTEPTTEAAWLLYLKHLLITLRWPALVLVFSGMALAALRAVRGPGRVRWTLALVFPLLYFWFISRRTLVLDRYVLPILPFLCVLAAAAVVAGVSLLRRFNIPRTARTALIIALTAAAILPPGVRAIQFTRGLSKRGTVALAYEWIKGNVPRGSKVVIESRELLLSPVEYRVENVPGLIWNDRQYKDYVADGVNYLIASSQCYGPAFESPQLRPNENAAYRRLFDQSTEVIRFTPTNDQPGPELRIFKLR